ncbi:glucosyltransferase domain-containing protein [Rouxiella sp. WC2420]|uniref:Glucosyltransferase domain-containing protein n=1 Tax=Rouxiella sp. WC2420 TaxID=3234145 RepID=A0AB39VS23_9GAMM
MLCHEDKKTLAIYTGLSFIFIYPLIYAGLFYRDDLDRAITGQYGWRGLGRPAADILMRILSASGHYNLDLFPYTTIASCFFLALSALTFKKHLSKIEVPHAKFVASLLIFNPFLLQSILYRYDCLGMVLGCLLSVVAYTYNNKNTFLRTAVIVVSGTLSLMFYQSSFNIFIGLLAVDIMVSGSKSEIKIHDSLKLIFKKLVIFIFIYSLYRLFLLHKHIARSELVSFDINGLRQIFDTISSLYALISSYFWGPVFIYFIIPIISMAFLVIFKRGVENKTKLLFYAFSLISILIFILSLMGPMILLKYSPVLPRTLYSFSVLLILIAIPITFYFPKLRYLSLLPVVCSFAFSAQLSSALTSQRNYEDFIFGMIAKDVITHPDIVSTITVGQVNINERTQLILNSKPLVGYFLSPATQFLASFQLINKGLTSTTYGYGEEENNSQVLQKLIIDGVRPEIKNAEYSIYFNKNVAIIKLGSTK